MIRPEARQLGRELGAALDARGKVRAHGQAERPEPWVLETHRAYPAEGSPALQADGLARVGQAAVYREAAGITNPRQAVGRSPRDTPSWPRPTRERSAPGDPRPQPARSGRPPGRAGGHRGHIPAGGGHRSARGLAKLRAERQAEADARARALELQAQGQPELAAQAFVWADASNIRGTELERAAKMYAAWEESTAPQREAAELALAELGRRKPRLSPPNRRPRWLHQEHPPGAPRVRNRRPIVLAPSWRCPQPSPGTWTWTP